MCWRGIPNDLGAQMTRDEHRAKCIEAMAYSMSKWWIEENMAGWKYLATVMAMTAFDALHGIARVVPIEATGKMIAASDIYWQSEFPGFPTMADVEGMWRAMSAAGDLTNPAKPEYPEGKP